MNKILVVVDMQNDFIDGSLGTPQAQMLVPKVADKIKDYEGKVMFTRDTHYGYYFSTLEGMKLPVKHCIKDTDGWQISKDVLDAFYFRGMDASPTIIDKPTFGSFGLIDTIADLMPQVEEIELCGLCTSICVLSNAVMLRAAYPNIRIVVNSALTECVNEESKQHALEAMKMCQIDVI